MEHIDEIIEMAENFTPAINADVSKVTFSVSMDKDRLWTAIVKNGRAKCYYDETGQTAEEAISNLHAKMVLVNKGIVLRINRTLDMLLKPFRLSIVKR